MLIYVLVPHWALELKYVYKIEKLKFSGLILD